MQKVKNIAIIAHVDHGKTTIVDRILHEAHVTDGESEDLVLDNNDLERERGITIVSKNVAIKYKGFKVNIIDTPGHADFGGEVERVLNMADGVLLLVDAFEGVMPQTRYVLSKAIQLGKKPLVVINKVDKDNCRPDEVHEEVFDLMFALDANEDQIDFPVIFGSAKYGWMSGDWQKPAEDMSYLLDQIIEHVPSPEIEEGNLQMQITTIDYSKYIGRIAIGRVSRGKVRTNSPVTLVKRDGSTTQSRVKELYTFEGMGRKKTEEVEAGDLCAIAGIEDFDIGDTVADFENPQGLPNIPIDEPTMSMLFVVNDSPFFGKDGKYITSRHLKERLYKEIEKNLALRVEETDSPDRFMVYGRGVMHISVLIETMRREGYEIQIGKPEVLFKEIDGVKMEPIEFLTIDVPSESSGKMIELLSQRKGELKEMIQKGEYVHLEFEVPSRGIIGLSTQVLNASAGEAIMSHRFDKYEPYKGEIPERTKGSLIVHEPGTTITYALDKLQDRGIFFVEPQVDVYEGQIVGENNRDNDLVVNVTRTKKLTNMRASGSDDKSTIPPPRKMSLEEYLEYINDDEYVEVTPKNIRLRKIHLKEHERKKAANPALA